MKTLKRTLCLVLVAVMALGLFAVAASAKKLSDYDDAASVSAEYKTAVDYATQLGILEGMGADTYGAKGNLTRAQLATMLYRMVTGDVAKKYVANYAGGAAFADVKADAWYAGYVNYAADKGLLAGIGNNKYDPNSALTGYQTLAAFLRALGYGVNGEFVGATWKAGVTKFADVIDGTIVADWSKPISREVAAQLILNTMSAKMVKWDAASKSYVEIDGVKFGFFYEKDTLAEVVFNLSETPVTAASDVYGNPVAAWKDIDTNKNVVEVPLDGVKTYTTKVNGCQLLKDLGYAETNLTSTVQFTVWNGEQEMAIDLSHADKKCEGLDLGGNGVLTKVYAVGKDEYAVTQTCTYLGKVESVTPAAHGSKAATVITVYKPAPGAQGWESITLETTAWTKGSYVLLTKSAIVDETPNSGWTVVSYAKSEVAAYSGFEAGSGKAYWLVGTKGYEGSFEWNLDTDKVLGTSYYWFYDNYGYIIGCDIYTAPVTYGVVDSIYWAQNGHGAGYADINLVYMNGDKANTTKITKAIDDRDTTDDALHCEDMGYGIFNYANVSDENTLNGDYYSDIFAIGADSLTQVGEKLGTVDLTKGQPGITYDVSGMNTTVYLMKYIDAAGKVAYASYTGYQNMPSVKNAAVEAIYGDAVNGKYYASYVFVDVTVEGAYIVDTVANTIVAFIVDNDVDGYKLTAKGDREYTYTVYVDGKAASVKTLNEELSDYEDADAGKLVKIVSGSDGYIDSVTEVTTNGLVQAVRGKSGYIVKSYDGTSMNMKLTGGDWAFYNVTAANFYFVDTTAGTITTKTVANADVTADTFNACTYVYVLLNADNTVAAIYAW